MKNQFTKGPVRPATDAQGTCGLLHPKKKGVAVAWFSDAHNPSNGYVGDQPEDEPKLGRPERQANAELIAATFNAATKLADMGLDAQATIEALPEIYAEAKLVCERMEWQAKQMEGDGNVSEWMQAGIAKLPALLTRCKGAE